MLFNFWYYFISDEFDIFHDFIEWDTTKINLCHKALMLIKFMLYYPHLNVGISFIRGQGYPRQQFEQAPDYRDALMVGSPQQIIEKILYQHVLFYLR